MTLNNTILKKLNNFKIFILDLIPIASNNTPQSNTTTGSSGSSLEYARADHVHPTDTSRAPNNHASTGTTYGLGSASNYGHVKTINSLSQSSHSDGTALSAYQGKVLNEIKMSPEDYLYIDTVDAEITYDDDSTDTIPLLADIRNIDGIMKVAIKWNDNNNENNTRPPLVAVILERNNEQFQIYTLNSENNWQKKVTVPIDDGQGNTYSYSWRTSISGYYSTNTTDGNLCIINSQILNVPSGTSTPT